MPSHNSPLVKGKKYRQLKDNYHQLQTQNLQLIRELGVLNKKYRDAQKKANELDQLVGEISTERDILEFLGAIKIDCTDENVITIESKNKRIVNLIRIIDQLNYGLALRQ